MCAISAGSEGDPVRSVSQWPASKSPESGSVQSVISPRYSPWSVTPAKSSGRSMRTSRVPRPSASSGGSLIDSPKA